MRKSISDDQSIRNASGCIDVRTELESGDEKGLEPELGKEEG